MDISALARSGSSKRRVLMLWGSSVSPLARTPGSREAGVSVGLLPRREARAKQVRALLVGARGSAGYPVAVTALISGYTLCQLTNRSPASVSSRLARPLVRAFARRLASSVGASHAENRSARRMWPPGASTRTHSVARDLVRPLIERGGDQHQVEGSIGKGSRSATPTSTTSRSSAVDAAATSIMPGAGSIPASSRAPGQRLAITRSR